MGKHYKEHLSGYREWSQLTHAQDWILFEDNLGEHVCIDEVALSQGELYTIVTNASARCQQGALIAIVKGVKSDSVINVLKKIALQKRKQVKEVTTDLAANMKRIGSLSFPEAVLVSDRFHVQQLPSEALQEMRIKYRWQAIEQENKQIKQAKEEKKEYQPIVFENGDTPKQLLARSRYILFKPKGKWTEKQQQRANILFSNYPDLEKGYELSMMLRGIYQHSTDPIEAGYKLNDWYEKVEKHQFDSFITAAHSIKMHQEEILNFFINRSTNALAESFNSKIKAFRAVFRGVRDIPFFLFRVSLIFA
ncbi:MAG: transposase [Cyclobacteriaceae bacterium]|nr:transposase [Cyclobacteriaceae bacterium]